MPHEDASVLGNYVVHILSICGVVDADGQCYADTPEASHVQHEELDDYG